MGRTITKYIYLSIVLKYSFWVSALYLNIVFLDAYDFYSTTLKRQIFYFWLHYIFLWLLLLLVHLKYSFEVRGWVFFSLPAGTMWQWLELISSCVCMCVAMVKCGHPLVQEIPQKPFWVFCQVSFCLWTDFVNTILLQPAVWRRVWSESGGPPPHTLPPWLTKFYSCVCGWDHNEGWVHRWVFSAQGGSKERAIAPTHTLYTPGWHLGWRVIPLQDRLSDCALLAARFEQFSLNLSVVTKVPHHQRTPDHIWSPCLRFLKWRFKSF